MRESITNKITWQKVTCTEMKLLQPALATRQSQKNEQEEIKTRRFFQLPGCLSNFGLKIFQSEYWTSCNIDSTKCSGRNEAKVLRSFSQGARKTGVVVPAWAKLMYFILSLGGKQSNRWGGGRRRLSKKRHYLFSSVAWSRKKSNSCKRMQASKTLTL